MEGLLFAVLTAAIAAVGLASLHVGRRQPGWV